MTGIGENTLAQPVKPPLRERRACLAKLVKNRLTLTRVNREGRVVHIYSDDLSRELVAHAVGTGADSWCEGQWETSPAQPEELPTQPVGTVVEQIAPPRTKPGFERFDFGRAE